MPESPVNSSSLELHTHKHSKTLYALYSYAQLSSGRHQNGGKKKNTKEKTKHKAMKQTKQPKPYFLFRSTCLVVGGWTRICPKKIRTKQSNYWCTTPTKTEPCYSQIITRKICKITAKKSENRRGIIRQNI